MIPILRVAVLAAGAASYAFLPSSGTAQPTVIRSGETVSGTLDGADPVLGDGSRYDLYVYRGSAGDRIVITLRSAAFDAYLFGGRFDGESFVPMVEDDDGGGGTNSRLTVTVGEDGTFAIRATSYEGGEAGEYTLSVVSAARPTEPVAPLPLEIGVPVTGRLEETDPQLVDGSFYDLYIYRGSADEQVVITLRSIDFDTYLYGGRFDGSSFVEQDYDDDSAGGTDARLTIRVGPDGTYAIRANSYEPGRTGAYTLTIERP